jgi:hypothetical protein
VASPDDNDVVFFWINEIAQITEWRC